MFVFVVVFVLSGHSNLVRPTPAPPLSAGLPTRRTAALTHFKLKIKTAGTVFPQLPAKRPRLIFFYLYLVCHGGLASLSSTSTAQLKYWPGQHLSTSLPASTHKMHHTQKHTEIIQNVLEPERGTDVVVDGTWQYLYCMRNISLVLFAPPLWVQEPEADDSGPGPGEVSSWDVNTERMTSTVGKLCKTESQNHMSPRYTADHYIRKHSYKIVLCHHVCTQATLDFR